MRHMLIPPHPPSLMHFENLEFGDFMVKLERSHFLKVSPCTINSKGMPHIVIVKMVDYVMYV